jgi:hypothetical protein
MVVGGVTGKMANGTVTNIVNNAIDITLPPQFQLAYLQYLLQCLP